MSVSSGYDEEAVREDVQEWVRNTLKACRNVQVKQVVPELNKAVLAFEISWESNARMRTDMTTLSKSLQEQVGPAARLHKNEARPKSLFVNMMPLPPGAVNRIHQNISFFDRASKKLSLQFYAVIFCVAFLIFAYYSIELYKHWVEYERPYEPVLDFIWYHILFLGGGTHTHANE